MSGDIDGVVSISIGLGSRLRGGDIWMVSIQVAGVDIVRVGVSGAVSDVESIGISLRSLL